MWPFKKRNLALMAAEQAFESRRDYLPMLIGDWNERVLAASAAWSEDGEHLYVELPQDMKVLQVELLPFVPEALLTIRGPAFMERGEVLDMRITSIHLHCPHCGDRVILRGDSPQECCEPLQVDIGLDTQRWEECCQQAGEAMEAAYRRKRDAGASV